MASMMIEPSSRRAAAITMRSSQSIPQYRRTIISAQAKEFQENGFWNDFRESGVANNRVQNGIGAWATLRKSKPQLQAPGKFMVNL